MQGRRLLADSRKGRRSLLLGWLGLCFLLAAPAHAAEEKGAVTGYAIPRFVSVRVDEANLRTGPGKYFPICLELKRRGMPVKVVDEFKLWRQVELHDHVTGWLHQSLITGRRTFLVGNALVEMLDDPSAEADVVAKMEPGALAILEECNGDWCLVSTSGFEGWVPRVAGWGALPGEDFED
jgi:SH3-like domain-containing protein